MSENARPSSSKRMSVQEARSVRWLRNNHRPLGELLDEGFLTEARLEWAAAKAYDPQLKRAAAVLLDGMRGTEHQVLEEPGVTAGTTESVPVIGAGLTIEQARTTLWPFRPFKGRPMGALVDARQLGLKDLAHAIENAWDARVRQAAIVLLGMRLGQVVEEPSPPAGPLRVVSSGKSYAERKELQLTLAQGALLGAALSVVLWLGLQSIRSLIASPPSTPLLVMLSSPEGVIALIVAVVLLVGIGWLVNYLPRAAVERLDKEIDNYRKGQEGEDQILEVLRQNLDGRWTLFRNVTLPGRDRGDIDAVLVGPPGVWALEIKTYSGEYRNVGERWQFRAGGRWRALRKSPSRQAANNAARLNGFFRADGLKQWVTAAVIWTNPESQLSVENPMVAVWTWDRLPEELGNIWQDLPIDMSARESIVEKLTMLCRRRAGEDD